MFDFREVTAAEVGLNQFWTEAFQRQEASGSEFIQVCRGGKPVGLLECIPGGRTSNSVRIRSWFAVSTGIEAAFLAEYVMEHYPKLRPEDTQEIIFPELGSAEEVVVLKQLSPLGFEVCGIAESRGGRTVQLWRRRQTVDGVVCEWFRICCADLLQGIRAIRS